MPALTSPHRGLRRVALFAITTGLLAACGLVAGIDGLEVGECKGGVCAPEAGGGLDVQLQPIDDTGPPIETGVFDASSMPCTAGTKGPTMVRVGTTDNNFCIDSTEVTNAEYDKFLGATDGGSVEAKLKMEKAGASAAAVAVVPPPASSAPATTEPPAEPGKKGGSKTLAFVAFGVGGAGLVVGAVTGLLAVGKHGDLADKCPDGKCTTDQQSDIDSYKTMGTISTIGFIVAGVGGVTGAVLLFTSPKESASAAPRSRFATVETKGVSLTPYFGGTSAGVSGHF